MRQQKLWLLVIPAILLIPTFVYAEMIVPATFADGKGRLKAGTGSTITIDTTVDNVVDAFNGMVGNGWTAGWISPYHDSSVYIDHVVLGSGDTTPRAYKQLVDGNYLSYQAKINNTSSARTAALSRNYTGTGGIDPTEDHTVQFTIRIDEDPAGTNFGTSDDRYQIHDRVYTTDGATSVSGFSASAATWGICVYGAPASGMPTGINDQWIIYDAVAGGYVDTDITVVGGTNATPYTFTIDFHPEAGTNGTYDVKIANGTTTLYDHDGFGLSTASGTYSHQVTGYFDVSVVGKKESGNTDNNREFSLDDVKISQVPEPTSLTFMLGMLFAALMPRRRD
jgi:hypothetical protein